MLFTKNNSIKKDQTDVIYSADEKTRRAIDSLYVSKKDRTKMVIGLSLIFLFVGFGIGYYASANTGSLSARTNTVEVKIAPELKAHAQ